MKTAITFSKVESEEAGRTVAMFVNGNMTDYAIQTLQKSYTVKKFVNGSWTVVEKAPTLAQAKAIATRQIA